MLFDGVVQGCSYMLGAAQGCSYMLRAARRQRNRFDCPVFRARVPIQRYFTILPIFLQLYFPAGRGDGIRLLGSGDGIRLPGSGDGNVAESGSFPSILRQFVAREYGNAALARRSPSIGALVCCEKVRISGHFCTGQSKL